MKTIITALLLFFLFGCGPKLTPKEAQWVRIHAATEHWHEMYLKGELSAEGYLMLLKGKKDIDAMKGR